MRWLRRTSLCVLAWLAAVMTVVAGVPHPSCRCPDGRVKPFCFGSTAQKGGCCCAGKCCGAMAGTASCCKSGASKRQEIAASCDGHEAEPAGLCCRHQKRAASRTKAQDRLALTRTCCTRTLDQLQGSAFTAPKRLIVSDVTDGAPLAAQSDFVWDRPTESLAFRQDYQRPPPTDLLTTLQRLLI
jgi:hypothetical protein